MKVLQIIATLSAGGAEGFIANLAVELVRQECEVTVYLLGGVRGSRGRLLERRLNSAGVRLIGTRERSPKGVVNFVQLARVIRDWRPDVVQANLRSGEWACIIARLLACDRRGAYVRRLANTIESSGSASTFGFRLRERAFDMTVACSEAVARSACRVSEKSRRGDRIFGAPMEVIVNGAYLPDDVPASDERAVARDALGVDERQFVVCHIGSYSASRGSSPSLLSSQKAQDVALRAFSMAFGESGIARMFLAGDGPLRPEAERLACELGISQVVRFAGNVEEPWQLLAAADVFLFPSRYEGMPNVLPEAGSCGLPVIASSIPEIEAVRKGDAWIFCSVDDTQAFASALRTVCGQRASFAERARGAADKFRFQHSMPGCGRAYLDLFQRIVSVERSESV